MSPASAVLLAVSGEAASIRSRPNRSRASRRRTLARARFATRVATLNNQRPRRPVNPDRARLPN